MTLMAAARKPDRTLTAYRIEVREEVDERGGYWRDWAWRWCGEHLSDSRVALALDEWLLENAPLPAGQYRAIETEHGWKAEIAYDGRMAA